MTPPANPPLAALGPDVPMPADRILRVYAARVTAGEPARLEHAELRWFPRADLDTVPWLPADLPIVAALRTDPDQAR